MIDTVLKGVAIVGITCTIVAILGVVFLAGYVIRWLSKETVE